MGTSTLGPATIKGFVLFFLESSCAFYKFEDDLFILIHAHPTFLENNTLQIFL